MKNHRENRSPVDALIEEAMPDDIPPSVQQDLNDQVDQFLSQVSATKSTSRSHFRSLFTFPRLAWVGSAGVATVLVFIFALFGSRAPGGDVYAAVLEALQKVHTVHVTGWTTSPSSYHSTVQDEPVDTSKRHVIDTWEWITEDGGYRFYDRQGPFTHWDDGDRRYEYHSQYDRLYVGKSKPRPVGAKFERIGERLKNLNEQRTKKTRLEERTINGRPAEGLRLERRHERRGDYWFDAETNLPVRAEVFRWRDGKWEQTWDMTVAYDREVPSSIVRYIPPKAKQVLYDWSIEPRFEKWNSRLRDLAERYQIQPLPEKMEMIPRENEEEIRAYTFGKMPGIKSHVVEPLQMSLADYLRTVGRTLIPRGSLRLSDEFKGIQFNHDLVLNIELARPAGQRERIEFVLDALGLELVETIEERKVWVAHYDGRPLKPWREVKAPVSREGTSPVGPGMASGTGAFSMEFLFDSFAYWQDYDLTAEQIVIVDKTGLPSGRRPDGTQDESAAVSSESPYWGGEKSIEIARKWFEDEFGVTFTEEIRPMKVHVIKRREG